MIMKTSRFVIGSAVIFVVALLWNGIVHLVILRNANTAIESFSRAANERPLWLGLLATALIALLFVWGYSRFAKNGTTREGLVYGVFFAVLAGVLADLNQFVLYPLPASLALKWFAFGLLEFCFYGFLVSRVCPVNESTNASARQMPVQNAGQAPT
jgi:hypothetical protein